MEFFSEVNNFRHCFRGLSVWVEDCELARQAPDAFLSQFVQQVRPASELFLIHCRYIFRGYIMMRLPMWGMALSVRCMVFRKDPEARRVASASGSCQGRRTESFRSITSSLPGDEGLLPTPLGHLLFDVDAVVVEHLFQCGKQAPAIAVLILFGLGREECERLVFVQPPPSVVDGRTVVKADEVLHRVECAGTLVGIYPRLALGRGVLHLEPLVVELLHGIVELGGILAAPIW